jgi:hypothetical protein
MIELWKGILSHNFLTLNTPIAYGITPVPQLKTTCLLMQVVFSFYEHMNDAMIMFLAGVWVTLRV